MRLLEGRNVLISLAGAALGLSGASVLSGCVDGPENCYEEQTCPPGIPLPAPPPSPCDGDPATARAVDGCGVFVSAQAEADEAKDANLGTRRRPFKSLQDAIVEAAAKGLNRVYACEGRFDEQIALPSGVNVWGGRRCEEGGDWLFAGPEHLTTIAPRSEGIPLRIFGGSDQEAMSTVFGVKVVAADGSALDGKSSIAVILSSGARAIVRSSEILAGNGKDGAPGEDAPRERARDGVPGHNGALACSADVVEGAAQVVTECEYGLVSIGGKGGDGQLDRGGDGAPGVPHSVGSDPSGRGANDVACSTGLVGLDGEDAGHAPGATGIGSLSVHGWEGVPGPDGAMGGMGRGGGGGGGGRTQRTGEDACRAGQPRGGGAGGSGGSGGCGGRGGKGGGYGGASIAIVALEGTEVWIEATTVRTGQGGHGGVGGTAQAGGRVRPPGLGGQGVFNGTDFTIGCAGGSGGKGGAGGDAGGGLGGHSIGVASVGTNVRFLPGDDLRIGHAGDGGFGANAAMNEGLAANGVSGNWVIFIANNVPPQ